MFRRATIEDFQAVLADPCAWAVEELRSIGAATALDIFQNSVGVTACEVDGKIYCIFGVRIINFIAGTGLIWFIATETRPRQMAALRSFPGLAALVPSTIAALCAIVDGEVNKRFARWCGMKQETGNYYTWRR